MTCTSDVLTTRCICWALFVSQCCLFPWCDHSLFFFTSCRCLWFFVCSLFLPLVLSFHPPPPFVWPNFFFLQFSLSASIHSCARTRACPQLYLHCTSRLKKKLLLQRSYCEDLFNTWNRPNRPDIRGNIQGTSWVSLVGVSRQGVKGDSTVSSKYSWNQQNVMAKIETPAKPDLWPFRWHCIRNDCDSSI